MLLTGYEMDVRHAKKYCLIDRIVPNSDLIYESFEVASELTNIPPFTIALIKGLVRDGTDLPLEKGLYLERLAALKHGGRG